jgi:DNA-binding NarL/FixJ family response regulator
MSSQTCKQILLIDEHSLVRRGLRSLIEQESDLRVCAEAENASEGLEKIQNNRPDLVILDFSLKGAGGVELIRAIRQEHPESAVLVVSSQDERLYAERSLRAGALGYVMKDARDGVFLEAIRRVLEGRIFVSPALNQYLLKNLSQGNPPSQEETIQLLSDREFEVFRMIGEGLETKEIAEKLCLSVKTVESYRIRIKSKLGIRNNMELIRTAVEWSLKNREEPASEIH